MVCYAWRPELQKDRLFIDILNSYVDTIHFSIHKVELNVCVTSTYMERLCLCYRYMERKTSGLGDDNAK